jgi:hypothetical protein
MRGETLEALIAEMKRTCASLARLKTRSASALIPQLHIRASWPLTLMFIWERDSGAAGSHVCHLAEPTVKTTVLRKNIRLGLEPRIVLRNLEETASTVEGFFHHAHRAELVTDPG